MFLVFILFAVLLKLDLGLFFVWVVAMDDYDWQLDVIGGLLAAGSGLTVCWARSSFSDGFPSGALVIPSDARLLLLPALFFFITYLSLPTCESAWLMAAKWATLIASLINYGELYFLTFPPWPPPPNTDFYRLNADVWLNNKSLLLPDDCIYTAVLGSIEFFFF